MFDQKTPFEGRIEGKRLIWEGEGEIFWLEPYGRDVFRFRGSRSLRIDETLNWTLLDAPEDDRTEIEILETKAVIRNGRIMAEVESDGTVRYFRDGKVILEESWLDFREIMPPLRKAREYRTVAGDSFRTSLYFRARKEEHFYGLGQDPNDCFDLKGCTVELCHKNTKCTIPFLYSSLGYGFLWNNPAIGRVELVKNHTLWQADSTRQMDYLVMAGETPAAVLERYTAITGRSPVLPEWAAGFWQSKLRYKTQEEVLEVAREHKRRGIPLSVLVIDYFHWTCQGEWKFDPRDWPDPKAMVRELEEMGIRIMVSIWPTVDIRSENYPEMLRKNYLIRAERGNPAFFIFLGTNTYYDATRPEARSYVWEKVKEHYYDLGIRMFWLDEAEPEVRPYDYDNLRYYLGNGLEVTGLYPYYYTKTFTDGMLAEGQKDVVTLSRCAWAGSQRLGTVVWSGDISSTFESLRRQLKAGLHMAMCAIPWWTTDIGGFLNGNPEDPEFRELLVRWFQFAVFCPILRMHGYRLPYLEMDINDPTDQCQSGSPNEIWSFGPEVYGLLRDLIGVRETIRPYLMEQMEEASRTGSPVMRPLLFDFPEDPEVWAVGDQYMFGPDLLVAPVVEYGARSRRVYLPEGSRWTHAASGDTWAGGRWITVEAPLEEIPVFFRDDFRMSLEPVADAAGSVIKGKEPKE